MLPARARARSCQPGQGTCRGREVEPMLWSRRLANDDRTPSLAPTRVLIPIAAGVASLIALALISDTPARGKLFDNLHWTLAYSSAAALAWLGTRRVRPSNQIAHRWFA